MKHIPVLEKEVLETFAYLKNKGGYFVDGTLGNAGHSISLLTNLQPTTYNLKTIGIDKDQSALDLAEDNIKKNALYDKFILFHDDFRNIPAILDELNVDKVSGILIDLGVSSMQLDDKSRGFSFSDPEAKLDMRMDQSQKLDAFNILNFYPIEKLEKIFRDYGEERFYKIIARNIGKYRKEKPIEKVIDLLEILKNSIPTKVIKTSKKHYATKVFQALRIEINQELTHLDKLLIEVSSRLSREGRFAVITFHSLEDRIVKETFKKLANPCECPSLAPCVCGKKPVVKLITKKPIIPREDELQKNPRSRSAKLRVVERI